MIQIIALCPKNLNSEKKIPFLKLTWPLKNGGEQTALSFREGKCPKVSEALTAHLLPYLFFSSPRSTSAGPAGHAGVSEI